MNPTEPAPVDEMTASPASILVYEASGEIVYANPAAAETLGVEEPGALEGTSMTALAHPDTEDETRRRVERVIERREAAGPVEETFGGDGGGATAAITSHVPVSYDDAPAGQVVLNERTDHGTTPGSPLDGDPELVESGLDVLQDVFYVFDEDGQFLQWNDRVSEVTGYTNEEIASMSPMEFVAGEDEVRVANAIQAVFDEGRATVQADLVTKDGETIPYEFAGSLLTDGDGDPVALCGIGRDLTQRRRMERRFQKLIEGASDLITVVDSEGKRTYVSPSVEHILGYGPEDVLGENAFNRIHPDDVDRCIEEFAHGIQRPGYVSSVEFRYRDADGSWRWLESRGRNLLHDPDVSGVVINSRDITERKRREQMLESLPEATHTLLETTTVEETCEVAVATARDVLEFPSSAVYLYDENEGDLDPVAAAAATDDLPDRSDLADADAGSVIQQVFDEGESRLLHDIDDLEDPLVIPNGPIRSGVVLPLGDHGVLLACSTEPDDFDEQDVDLAGLLAAVVESALDRNRRA